jgi:hypothetical protein
MEQRTDKKVDYSLVENSAVYLVEVARRFRSAYCLRSQGDEYAPPKRRSTSIRLCLVSQNAATRTVSQEFKSHRVTSRYSALNPVFLLRQLRLVSRDVVHGITSRLLLLFMSVVWDCVAKLRSPMGLQFIPRWYTSRSTGGRIMTREKINNSNKNLSQCHLTHHKSHMDWPSANPSLCSERLTAWAKARPIKLGRTGSNKVILRH